MLQGAESIVDRFVRAIDADPAVSEPLEAEFVAVALAFSEQYGISYATWREIGIPRTVLCRAGISVTSGPSPRCARRNKPAPG